MTKAMALDGTLNHAEVNVIDLGAAIEFYDWFLGDLGYTVHQNWDRGRSWTLGPTYIVVTKVESRYQEPAFHRKRAGLNHLAFQASSKERVDGMHRKLRERGVAILYGGPEPGANDYPYAVYFEGPERLKLEYVWPGPFDSSGTE
jgi:catechol 2,3-dioxygenase-like lactoylglutathione lyase family enzyme